MSALQRSAMSARIAKLPQLPPGIEPSVAPFSPDGEDMDEEENDDLGDLPRTIGVSKQ